MILWAVRAAPHAADVMRIALPRCSYCKRAVAKTHDHIVPRYHGGPDTHWNLVPICHRCNFMLSCFLPARDGDTIGILRWKKERFLRACRTALRKSRVWRRLTKEERWCLVCRGTWISALPNSLQRKYQDGWECRPGRMIGRAGAKRWSFKKRK